MSIAELALRVVIAFFTLLFLTRIMGRKELSQMTFFNFVSAITIGALTAVLVMNPNVTILNGVLALVGWTIITIVLGFIDIKSKKARGIIEGQPRILIKNGKIMEHELRKVRLDVDALNALLREKEVFAVSDVDYAIFETDGKLSVMKKEAKQSLLKSDLGIQNPSPKMYPISTEVINDGRIITSNLEKLNLNTQWLEKQLKLAGVNSITDVFYAEVKKDGTLYIDNKNDVLH
ncbi:YetF domain-containing protein [Halalkalibacter urbisdiaboli]|uniref:YetF domain-containing protein n=1 Tax=Halalkalibacter urbisdiaboli TaxID=1960589 RepID=UPI000B44E1C7|nr:DUF421 domain-containing protein [Halalkalibacter urbisdiaboli]